MAAYPRVHTISRWKQWQHTVRMWLPGAFIGLLGVGGVIYGFCIAPNLEMVDVQGAIPRRGMGVVSSVIYLSATRGNTNPGTVASVVINGTISTIRTYAPLYKNERVRVVYRVGKSGRLHIDSIEQEDEAKP